MILIQELKLKTKAKYIKNSYLLSSILVIFPFTCFKFSLEICKFLFTIDFNEFVYFTIPISNPPAYASCCITREYTLNIIKLFISNKEINRWCIPLPNEQNVKCTCRSSWSGVHRGILCVYQPYKYNANKQLSNTGLILKEEKRADKEEKAMVYRCQWDARGPESWSKVVHLLRYLSDTRCIQRNMSTPRHGRNRDCACDSLPRVKRHLVWIKSKCVLSGYVVSWKSVTIEEDESDPETRGKGNWIK